MKVTLIWGWPTKVGGVMATRVPKCNDEGWMTMGNDGQVTKGGGGVWWNFFIKMMDKWWGMMKGNEGTTRDELGKIT